MDNAIEIQGQLYDGISGNLLPLTRPEQPTRSVGNDIQYPRQVQPQSARPPVNDVVPHRPQPAPVLMRSTVTKPTTSLRQNIRVSGQSNRLVDQVITRPATATARRENPNQMAREIRAANTPLSPSVSRFNTQSINTPMQPPVTSISQTMPTATPVPSVFPLQPAQPPVTSQPAPNDDVFSKALRAVHEPVAQPKKRSKSKRHVWAIAAVLLFLVVGSGSVFAVKDHAFTRLELAIASSTAGFQANIPAANAAGYSLAQFHYATGVFTSQFTNKSTGHSYTLTEKKVGQGGQVLLATYVTTTSPNYKMITIGNQVLYLYGNGTASWVRNGIWYEISSNGSLSRSQLIDLVNSLGK